MSPRDVMFLVWTDATLFVKRRLAVVLVLATMASDEATSSLDSATEREIVVLEAGTVVERGTHEALLRHKGSLRCIVAAQQHGAVAAR